MSGPEESARFAYVELAQLARADGRVRGSERRALERFARHLGISESKARRYARVAEREAAHYPDDPQRQLDLLQMLARVAYADGELQPEERGYFERLSDEFGIPRTRLARVLEFAEAKAQRRGHLDRRWIAAGLAIASILGTILWLHASRQPDEMTGFKSVDAVARKALVLVHTRYVLERQGSVPKRLSATGTGFFVRDDGLVLTNKHVVQPWRFVGKALDLIADGYALREDSVERLAWRERAIVLDEKRKPRRETAFSSVDGSLELVCLAPDAELPLRARASHLRRASIFCHANDDGDLALLRCAVRGPVSSVPLALGTDQVRRLDPVLVLGYPRGLHLLETARAASTPTVGRVRKVEGAIYVTAPIVSGNSGGPLFDREGRVIGIATRTFGSATLAACLRIEHAHALVESAAK